MMPNYVSAYFEMGELRAHIDNGDGSLTIVTVPPEHQDYDYLMQMAQSGQ